MTEQNARKNPESAGVEILCCVRPGVEAKAVHSALDKIFELVGCPSCGFNGILDLSISVINPKISDGLARGGIVGISQNLRGF